jgi:hypothetical protein
VSALGPESSHFFLGRGTGASIDNKHLVDVESGSRSDQVPEILLLLDVEHEHIRLRALFEVVLTHLFSFFIFYLLGLRLLHCLLGFLINLCIIFHFTQIYNTEA